MNDSDRNNPKPLPDDFGMTIPNMRLPKQGQGNESDLPTTNLRSAPPVKNPYAPPPQQQPPQAAAEDFGMTIPNMRPPLQQQQQSGSNQQPPAPVSNFDLTAPNMPRPQQPPPTEPDFGMTLNNFQPKNNNVAEPDYGATMSYIPAPTTQRNTNRESLHNEQPPLVLPELQPNKSEQRKKGVPLWAWLLGGGFALFLLLLVATAAAYFLIPRNSGFTLILKGAPAGSTVLVDGTLRGVTSADGSIKIPGIEAEKKRSIKVTHEGFTDFNDTFIGENGETRELIAQMKKTEIVSTPPIQKNDCDDPDPRVCAADLAARDALDKLPTPFTVDQLVAALNLQIINFGSNSADVPPARKRFLERAAEKFKLLTGKPVVEVGGHTDNVGNDAANLSLSLDRAKAVRGLLVNFGVVPNVLTTRGFGSKKPKTTNDTEDGKFQNRRIEYTVISR